MEPRPSAPTGRHSVAQGGVHRGGHSPGTRAIFDLSEGPTGRDSHFSNRATRRASLPSIAQRNNNRRPCTIGFNHPATEQSLENCAVITRYAARTSSIPAHGSVVQDVW